jgi:hypothetical protein
LNESAKGGIIFQPICQTMIQIEIPDWQLLSALLCKPSFCLGFCSRHVYLFLERLVVENVVHRNCCLLSAIVLRRIEEDEADVLGSLGIKAANVLDCLSSRV